MRKGRAGIKIYRADSAERKKERGSVLLWGLQAAVLCILMIFWWNALLEVFRMPFDRTWLYGGTAAAVLILSAADRRFGIKALPFVLLAAAVLLWLERESISGLYEWILQNYETLFTVYPAGEAEFGRIAVLFSVPVLSIMVIVQRRGKGKLLAGIVICAPFIAAACAGWFQTEMPSWLLLLGAAVYFASAAPGAGRTGKGFLMWGNAVFAVAVCAVLAVLSCRAGLILDTGRGVEDSFYFRMRGTLTNEVVGGIQDLLTEVSGTDQEETDPNQADEVPADTESADLPADESIQSELPQDTPVADDSAAADLSRNDRLQDNTGGTGIFESPSSESQSVTDLGSIARFVPSSEGPASLVLDEKPEGTVYFPESWGITYSENAWHMIRAENPKDDPAGDPEEVRAEYTDYPAELRDTLAALCSEWADGGMEEVSAGISRELHRRAVYNTEPGAPPAGEEFLNYFLFENHKGFCVHFATAATLMYRYCGYEARYAEGYAIPASAFREIEPGKYEAQITGDMGHAWCQVYDGQTGGWMDMEHTPSAPGDVTGQPPAASSDYQESIRERVVNDILPVLLLICIAAGVCVVLFFGQAAVRTAGRERRFRKKNGGEGIREMYAAVIKTAAFQGEEIKEPLQEELAEQLYKAYPELGEKEWKWMYTCVMKSMFYHLDNEKKDWEKMRELYTRFRKAALRSMSRGQRWRYRYVRCL